MRPAPWSLAVLLLATTCNGAEAAPGPHVVPTAPAQGPSATVAPSVLDEVAVAYQRSWAVYAEAVGHLDPTALPEAFAGSALTLKRREVAALRAAGEAVRVRVEHHPEIALVDTRTAVVTDVLGNHMVRVDATTGRPLEADPDDVLTRAYTLRREDGTWKVTEAVALG